MDNRNEALLQLVSSGEKSADEVLEMAIQKSLEFGDEVAGAFHDELVKAGLSSEGELSWQEYTKAGEDESAAVGSGKEDDVGIGNIEDGLGEEVNEGAIDEALSVSDGLEVSGELVSAESASTPDVSTAIDGVVEEGGATVAVEEV